MERREITALTALFAVHNKTLPTDCIRLILSYLINTCNGYKLPGNIYCQVWVTDPNSYCTMQCLVLCTDHGDANYGSILDGDNNTEKYYYGNTHDSFHLDNINNNFSPGLFELETENTDMDALLGMMPMNT